MFVNILCWHYMRNARCIFPTCTCMFMATWTHAGLKIYGSIEITANHRGAVRGAGEEVRHGLVEVRGWCIYIQVARVPRIIHKILMRCSMSCAVLSCAVLCCAALRCAVLHCAVLCYAVRCCAALCCAVLCCAVLRCAVLRCTLLSSGTINSYFTKGFPIFP